MTKEEKNLLLKYLCMALPYGVICYNSNTEVDFKLEDTADIDSGYPTFDYGCGDIESVSPYLRPMLSMTDEEKEEMHKLLSPEGTAIYGYDGISMPMNHYGEFVPYEFMNRIIQYLLKNHFDFMGLISKGLASEAPNGMYN